MEIELDPIVLYPNPVEDFIQLKRVHREDKEVFIQVFDQSRKSII